MRQDDESFAVSHDDALSEGAEPAMRPSRSPERATADNDSKGERR